MDKENGEKVIFQDLTPQLSKAAWMAISIFDNIYSIYFGLLDSLKVKTGIPMGEEYIAVYECFVNEKNHGLDFRPYKNIYDNNKQIN